MEDRNAIVPLSDAEEVICAYFIENPIAMRRVVQMMPHGDPPLDFLQKLWSYAAKRNRKVDLANALLSYDKRSDFPQIKFGRDWYCDCHLPSDCPEMFWEVQKFSWVRDDVKLSDYEDFDEVDAILSWMMYIKEMVGDGIVDMESTLRRIRLKRNGILRVEQRLEEAKERLSLDEPGTEHLMVFLLRDKRQIDKADYEKRNIRFFSESQLVKSAIDFFSPLKENARLGKIAYCQGQYDRAFELLNKNGVNEDAEAQYLIGRMYANGNGVEQDRAKASECYLKAAMQGHTGAIVEAEESVRREEEALKRQEKSLIDEIEVCTNKLLSED